MKTTTAERSHPPLRHLQALIGHPDYPETSREDYFSDQLSHLSSPFMLPDMERAVRFLDHAISAGHHIYIAGDRDVDGVSSTAMLAAFLDEHHRNPGAHLTVRVSDTGDDYGLTGDFFEDMIASHADLIVLLDMGSSHAAAITRLLDRNCRIIILDHHQIPVETPEGENLAFVNPVRSSLEERPATVGLVFKFLIAYALFQTKERHRYYFIPEREGEPQGSGFLYGLGIHLGSFHSPGEAQKSLSVIPEADFHTLCGTEKNGFMSARSVNRIRSNPVEGGAVLLADRINSMPRLSHFIQRQTDLLAIGTITDMMPLVGENRIHVRLGMGLLKCGSRLSPQFRPGIRALLKQLRLTELPLQSRDIGWSIGPSLNAAGRMGETKLALDLLRAKSDEEAQTLAKRLIQLNQKRRERTANNQELIERSLSANPEKRDAPLLFCYDPALEPGVSGIVATRLVERYGKPVVYINPDGGQGRGSARGPDGVNVLEFLSCASDLFTQYGGHTEACGFSIPFENIPLLEVRLIEYAKGGLFKAVERPRERKHHIDLDAERIDWRILDELKRFEPFGAGNPEPVIRVRGIRISDVRMLSEGKHVRFRASGTPEYAEFIIWNVSKSRLSMMEERSSVFQAVGGFEKSFFGRSVTLRFRVEELSIDNTDR